MMDSSIIRAHRHAMGARKQQNDAPDSKERQAIGRSVGGLSTKIHAKCDSHGNPVRFILTGGQASDYRQAIDLIKESKAQTVLADKGNDTNYVVDQAQKMGAVAVIPPQEK